MREKKINRNISAEVETFEKITIVPSLLDVICRSTGMGFAAVARVTDSEWVACSVRDDIQFGLKPGGKLELQSTLCYEIREHQKPVVIDHVEKDEVYCKHHTPAKYGFQSYISVPIFRKDGSFFGTLCAIDPNPANLNNQETLGMFQLFADLISFHLNVHEQLENAEAKLLEEQKISELRDQFIAILGHDLRNPLSTVIMGTELLSELSYDKEMHSIVSTVKSSAHRMAGLIENILDFARSRLGDGITLNREENVALEKIFRQIINEMKSIWPNREIITEFELDEPVNCDSNRIAQLFSNLLANALMHGNTDTPIHIFALSNSSEFKLTITNSGEQIKTSAIKHLFKPFYKGDDKSGKNGLGLGLYIASEIAKVHGGELSVESNEIQTSFTLQIPAKSFEEI